MVDPEGGPRQDDDEDCGDIGLRDVVADLPLQRHLRCQARVRSWTQTGVSGTGIFLDTDRSVRHGYIHGHRPGLSGTGTFLDTDRNVMHGNIPEHDARYGPLPEH